MKTKAELIAAMIADEKSPFTEADKAALETLTVEHLTVLSGQNREQRITALVSGAKPEDKAATEAAFNAAVSAEVAKQVKAAAAAPKTVDEALAAMPAEISGVLRSAMATSNAAKAAVIKVLVDSKRCDISEADLKQKSITELQALVKLANLEAPVEAVDFSGVGAPRNSQEKQEAPAAPDLNAAIRAAKK